MDKNSNESLVQSSYDRLKDAIITGAFSPGEKLNIEKLKNYLGIGPTPIREALSRLTATDLVVAAPNRGFYVKEVTLEEVQDIYSTFLKIELLALKDSMQAGDASWEASIIAALYKLSLVEKSASVIFEDWIKANYEFHYALISGCKSPTLLKIRDQLYQRFDRYCRLSILGKKGAFSANLKEHEEIAKAVISRDVEKAEKLMHRHLDASLKQVIEKLKKLTS
ncbi:MAG: GntR family transcriptional regulator [Parachlamydiaceae bacterium]